MVSRKLLQRIFFSVCSALVLTILASPLFGQSPASPTHQKKHDIKREVEKLEEQWRVAQVSGDTATMDKMLADDFVGISMSGQINTKDQQLERVRTRKLVVTKIELSDMKVKLLGPVAIVTSLADVEGTNEGESVKGRYRYTRVYQRGQNGGWKITNFEATRIREHGAPKS